MRDVRVEIPWPPVPHGTALSATIAEAFALQMKSRPRRVFTASVPREGIVLIVGPSGAGKSALLRALKAEIDPEYDARTAIDATKPICDLIAMEPPTETVHYLAEFGFGEPAVLCTPFCFLSEGQKARFVAAFAIHRAERAVFIDEFTSMLDRPTARLVARVIAKLVRRRGQTAYIATVHEDIIDALQPNHVVTVSPTADVTSIRAHVARDESPSDVVIADGTMDDYLYLSQYHYSADEEPQPKLDHIYTATAGESVVGVRVLARPWPVAFERLPVFARINSSTTRGWRTIVHPEFRGTGVMRRLCEVPPPEGKSVFSLTQLGAYIPHFEILGYEPVRSTTDMPTPAQDALSAFLLNDCRIAPASVRRVRSAGEFIASLPEAQLAALLGHLRDSAIETLSNLLAFCTETVGIAADEREIAQAHALFNRLFATISLAAAPALLRDMVPVKMAAYVRRYASAQP